MSCPDFFAGFSSHVRANAAVYRSVSVVLAFISNALIGSVFLATLAPSTLAAQALITLALSGCDGERTVRELASQAVLGCDVVLLVCGAVSVPLVVSVVLTLGLTLPGVAAVAPFALLFGALRVVLVPISGGRAPTTGALVALTGALGAFAGADVSGLQRALQYGIGEADRKSGSPLRSKAGGSMTIVDSEKNYLRLVVREPERQALVASSAAIKQASAAAVAGDFRPLVIEAAKARARALAALKGKFVVSSRMDLFAQADVALRHLDAIVKTPVRRWSADDALRVINTPAAGASVGSSAGPTPRGPGSRIGAGTYTPITGPYTPPPSSVPGAPSTPSTPSSSVFPVVVALAAARFLLG